MCSYDVRLGPCADLCDGATRASLGVTAEALGGRWAGIDDPPGQALFERLVALGYAGARYLSLQRPDGINLVAWRWTGPDARIVLLDRFGEAPDGPMR